MKPAHIIAELPKDVQRLIDKLIHTNNQQKCFQELFRMYQWSDSRQCYCIAFTSVFNCRKLRLDNILYTDKKIWKVNTSTPTYTNSCVPACYFYSSSKNRISGFK